MDIWDLNVEISNKLIINDKNDLNGIETNINTPKIFYKDKDKAKSTKHLKKYHSRNNRFKRIK